MEIYFIFHSSSVVVKIQGKLLKKWLKSSQYQIISWHTLCEKCLYWEFFWSAFSRIQAEYREINRISLYSVQTRENTDQKNSQYGHFSCLDKVTFSRKDEQWSSSYLSKWYGRIFTSNLCFVLISMFSHDMMHEN